MAIELAAACVPILSIPATGLIFFSVTYFSGLTFLLRLAYIFKVGGDPTKISADEIAQTAKEATEGVDFKKEYKQAKEGFKKMREEGNLEEQAKGVDIESD